MAAVWVQWVAFCSEYKVYVDIPTPVWEFLARCRNRASFHDEITRYGDGAFVLNALKKKDRIAKAVCCVLLLGIVGTIGYFCTK